MSDEKNIAKIATFNLGTQGAVRLRLGPELKFEADNSGLKVTKGKNTFSLKGTHKNLIDPIPCTLEWTFSTDLRGAQTVPQTHRRPTRINPTGDKYVIQERSSEHEAWADHVTLDILELGLLGKGTLNYKVTFNSKDALGSPEITGEPIEVDLPVNLEIAREPGGTSVWSNANSKAPPASIPLQIGEPLQLHARAAEGLKDLELELRIYEVEKSKESAPSKESPPNILGAIESDRAAWELKGDIKLKWLVGEHEGNDGLRYPGIPGTRKSHLFAWQVAVLGPPNDKGKSEDLICSEPKHFGTAPHPQLKSLTLRQTREPQAQEAGSPESEPQTPVLEQLEVAGAFEGFHPSLKLDLAISLFVMDTDEKGVESTPTAMSSKAKAKTGVPGDIGSTPEELEVTAVENGVFRAVVFKWDSRDKEEFLRVFPALKLFAAVKFKSYEAPFGAVAGYQANIKGGDHTDGFAPFHKGGFYIQHFASQVCSNAVDLGGRVSAVVAPLIPPEFYGEYQWFLATIVGEARNCLPGAIRGVAYTIMNRAYPNREEPNHKGSKIFDVISANGQFEAYSMRARETNFIPALRYFKAKYLEGKSPEKEDNEIERIEEIIIPIFLDPDAGELGGNNRGDKVNYYYSPGAQRAMGRPDPDMVKYHEVTKLFITDEDKMNYPNLSGDFRFFKWRNPTPERSKLKKPEV